MLGLDKNRSSLRMRGEVARRDGGEQILNYSTIYPSGIACHLPYALRKGGSLQKSIVIIALS